MAELAATLSVVPQGFEAEVFGAPVWRLNIIGEVPERRDIEDLIRVARRENVALIACRISADSPLGVVLSQTGFRKVERLMTFLKAIPVEAVIPEGIGIGDEADADAAVEIGRTVFRFDRYHADPEIPDAVADEIKARWVHNGITGRADTPLVARIDGHVAGFNLCMRRGEDAVIDLIGVAGEFQGKGVGARLVAGAIAHYAGRALRMWVGTQEDNPVSLVLYRKSGFTLHDIAETWHWTG